MGEGSFRECASLRRIRMPSTVREIGQKAFSLCRRLVNVELNEGLTLIDSGAFRECTSLQNINIPSTVRMIGEAAFTDCKMVHMHLNEGLECIEKKAFCECKFLEFLKIPATVEAIGESAFANCPNLVAVEHCDEIEEFVSGELIRDWYDRGRSDLSVRVHRFLKVYNGPK